MTRAGPAPVLASLVRHSYTNGVSVYNLEVEGDHTYFVGTANGGLWVHNNCLENLSREELLETISGSNKLLRQLWGEKIDGAKAALENPPHVPGLSRDVLEAYREIARRQIAAGLNSTGVHDIRIQIIDKVLGR